MFAVPSLIRLAGDAQRDLPVGPARDDFGIGLSAETMGCRMTGWQRGDCNSPGGRRPAARTRAQPAAARRPVLSDHSRHHGHPARQHAILFLPFAAASTNIDFVRRLILAGTHRGSLGVCGFRSQRQIRGGTACARRDGWGDCGSRLLRD